VCPGANDNLSAVGALLAVARAVRERPVEGLRVLLVSTGSEESFMEGMQAFGRRHFPALSRETTDMLCLECLGSPRPTVLEGEGMLKMRLYPAAARERLAAAATEAGVPVQRGLKTVLATDGLIALRAGYRVATLVTVDELKLPSNYHGPHDVPDNLHWDTLADCARTCEAWVRGLAPSAA
jgi:Zn-dependent M28 family amino/carboxypeptidase